LESFPGLKKRLKIRARDAVLDRLSPAFRLGGSWSVNSSVNDSSIDQADFHRKARNFKPVQDWVGSGIHLLWLKKSRHEKTRNYFRYIFLYFLTDRHMKVIISSECFFGSVNVTKKQK
jgi:hypothetical protein